MKLDTDKMLETGKEKAKEGLRLTKAALPEILANIGACAHTFGKDVHDRFKKKIEGGD
jgi:hypothetical protein